MSSRDPNDLCPELRPIYFQWLAGVKAAGHFIVEICTWRSLDEQAKLAKSGASGRSHGPHNYVDAQGHPASKAFDFALIINGKLCWDTHIDADHDRRPDYEECGKIGEDLGLVWGGHWKSLVDCDHLQLKGA